MKWHEQYEAFKKLMIQEGIQHVGQIGQALPFGCTVPPSRISRWLGDMLKVPTEFSTQRRYVNRFKIGADPEFIFVANGHRVDASTLELQQGLAFGMDNNGRLTELRPAPSRSAVEVVASILAELRWLAIFKPATLGCSWQAGAFLLGDGLGGHVHFGRKRPGRNFEVRALDTIEEELLHLKAYPAGEILRRRQGDDRHQVYGMPGDIRPQMHGYEYRTFPSWLDSPELAFLTLVLSKLAVHNPNLVQGYEPLRSSDRYFQRTRNLLAYYKDLDDDARLALAMIMRKMPVHIGGDFKTRWGIPTEVGGPTVKFIPSSIVPSSEDIAEVFACLENRTPLTWRVPTPTWSPLVPPENYVMMIATSNTRLAKGLGELIWDIVGHKSLNLIFGVSDELRGHSYLSIPSTLARQLSLDWRKLCNHKVSQHEGDSKYIYFSKIAREQSNYNEVRRLLLETVLPFWKVTEVKADSFQQWQMAHQNKRPTARFAGKVLLGSAKALPLRGLE